MVSTSRMIKDRENRTNFNKQPQYYAKCPINLLLDRQLKAVDVRVWLYLKWRQGTNKSAWPSLKRIADDLNISRHSVQRSVRRLKQKGWLDVQDKNTNQETRGRGRTYHFSTKAPSEQQIKRTKFAP